jgi:hypothetical protein
MTWGWKERASCIYRVNKMRFYDAGAETALRGYETALTEMETVLRPMLNEHPEMDCCGCVVCEMYQPIRAVLAKYRLPERPPDRQERNDK